MSTRLRSLSRRSRSSRSATQPLRGGAEIATSDPYDISGVGWLQLEDKFHELMALMESTTTGINALEARAAHRARVSEIIASLLDRAQEECRRLLADSNGETAEEAGVRVLRLREIFYGANHLALVPAYLHLARTKQFLERYGEAEDMLSLAQFIVLKHQDSVSLAMKAELHQTFGLLYAADDKLEAAVQHLSCASYYLTRLHGPQSIFTTFSYFDLGNVFAAKASMESAMALYDAVKEIWYDHLVQVLNEVVALKAETAKMVKYQEEDNGEGGAGAGYASARAFGAENLTDASKMLYGIYGIQKERFRVDHPSTARAAFVLGLFLLWVEDEAEARRHLLLAHSASKRFYGPQHPIVEEMEEWCRKFDIALDNSDTIVGADETLKSAPATAASTARADSQAA